MNLKEQESASKLTGRYYTPPAVALFLVRWVMVRKPLTILEPSIGDGAFVEALQGLHRYRIHLTGIDS